MYGNKTVQRQDNSPTASKTKCKDRVRTEMGKQNSRTFSFFKDSISSQFRIKQRENALFFSQKRRDEKANSTFLILTQGIKTRTTAHIDQNRIRVASRSLTSI